MAELEFTIPALGGRAGVFKQAKTVQVFGSFDDLNFALEGEPISGIGWEHGYLPQTPDCTPVRHKCERLYRVGSRALVAWRDEEDPQSPLSVGEIESLYPRGSLPSVDRGGAGWLSLFVQAATCMGNYFFFMDVGQNVEFPAYSVSASLVGPSNMVQITQSNNAQSGDPAQRSGDAILDALVGARIEPVEFSTGLRETKYTQLVSVAAGSVARIPVPPLAREIRVYQSTQGSTATWLRKVAGTVPNDIGVLNFTNRHSADDERFIGREGAFETDIDALSDRVFQIEWTVRP